MNNTDKQLPTVYDPADVEKKWYAFWTEQNYFHAEVHEGKPHYCITIPPPNVTGSLHIGHALCYTIQDVLIRWKRMQGYETLCLPGTDHAGIATQNKVEQQIAEEGLTRHDLGREEFLKRVWAWKTKYGGEILHQFKTMGFSFDWERERFTMDDGYVDAVLESFIRLFDKGYIYRGARVINWCPRCHTAISDIEVEYAEQKSHMWHFRYPLEDGSGHVVVATTRPETMLGDTAVAVNPNDERYRDMVGKTIVLPLVGRRIPVVADEYVDVEFGTGAVKVTPAHDPNDFEIGIRHSLPQVVVIGNDGSMTEEAGASYQGLDRFKARKRVVADLTEQGLIEKIEDYTHSVGTCARCHTVIEPLLSEQWFCKMQELAKPAIDVVKQGKVKFFPDRYAAIYIDWMENVRDWCISRQLWWGHRIPVWKCDDCGEYTAAKTALDACSKCGSANVTQDPDVLDTWFSSALWPFATLGWPEDTRELKYFYPTDVLVTAQDIIYLWVARMIFSGMEYLDEIPFKDVYIYATVMNEEGKRMSKSLGTGVDPLDLIDKFGADALRFALIQQAGMNQDLRFSEKRVEDARRFCNKLWNAARFVILNLDGFVPKPELKFDRLPFEDRWIIARIRSVTAWVNYRLGGPKDNAAIGGPNMDNAAKPLYKRIDNEKYNMDKAASILYNFVWNDFCDQYIELAKPRLKGGPAEREEAQAVLYYVLETTLRLLHPIIPFITEEIWQALPHEGESIMKAEYPVVDKDAVARVIDNNSLLEDDMEWLMDVSLLEKDMEWLMDLVSAVRDRRAAQNLPLRGPSLPIVLSGVPEDIETLILENKHIVQTLANVSEVRFVDHVPDSLEDFVSGFDGWSPGASAWTGVITGSTRDSAFAMPVIQSFDAEKELARIDADLQSLDKDLAPHEAKLSSEQFTSKAPAAIVEKERRIVAELTEKKQKLVDRKRSLGG